MTALKAKKGAPLVWRVVDFQNRFELPDDIRIGRQGPLTYAKLYVSANNEASATYLKQIDRLTRRPDGMELEGGWVRILRAVSNHGNVYRGYLVNDRHGPASEAEIAADVLYCDADTPRRILSGLAEVGLIEQVQEPDWEARAEELKPAKTRDKPPKKPATKKTTSGRGKAGFQNVRENSGTFAKKAAPSRSKSDITSEPKEKENSNGKRGKAKTEGKAKANESPFKPQEATLRGVTAPSASAPPRATGGAGIVKLADALPRAVGGLAHGYALGADDFADEIYGLLQCPMDRDSLDGRRELGNFRAALLAAIDAGLSPSQIEEVIAKGKTDASRIGRNRRRHCSNGGSPEKYWRFLWGKRVTRGGNIAPGGRDNVCRTG